MLDVIDRFGGDVIKFAGDALYVLWSATALNSLESCVEKGFLCSIAIRNKCNNYAVNLDSFSTISPSSKESVVYMNVHCALSVGIIAAVDVGCAGRWELLLLGYFIVGLFCYICSFLLFVWLFFFTYALLTVVYVSHVENRFFNTPRL
jgi:hypothetical protein